MSTTYRPKLAAIVTTYFKYSHAQHIVDRFLYGYGWKGTHYRPPMDMVSLHVEQVGEGDLSRSRSEQFPSMRIYPTIAEALTLGGSNLAVDGVVVVGEHGKYPRNEKGQTQYPRWEFFQQIIKVFNDSQRSVPMFNDKHLSWNWDWAKRMVDTSREMGFAYMAGSSLPVTWRIPSVEMPLGSRIREALCVGYGGVDSYDFHGLETIQCMVERRQGGETGVKWLQAYRGEKFWDALREGRWSRRLMEAALCRSHTLAPVRPGFNDILPTDDDLRRLLADPIAYQYEHNDGLLCTMILLNGLAKDFNFGADVEHHRSSSNVYAPLVKDFNFAAEIEGRREPFSTQMYLPMPDGRTTLADFFNPLVNNMERMFLTGKPTYPVERTLLTTGLVAAGIESLYRQQARFETPHLAITYQPTPESTFMRD
ncbi:MAG: hypothetical protein P4N24_12870 [Acidobacteriota bacterium]|nr:hypothetical protein [Acidobacteriota bacterium]